MWALTGSFRVPKVVLNLAYCGMSSLPYLNYKQNFKNRTK